MDIAILGDTSRSMKKIHREKLVQLVNDLIDELGVSPEGSHYGFITFDRYAKLIIHFSEPVYHDKEILKKEIEQKIMDEPKEWGTRTDLAFNLAATQLFTQKGGDRPDAKNVMLVFTDGKPKISRRDEKPVIPFSKSTKSLEVSQS